MAVLRVRNPTPEEIRLTGFRSVRGYIRSLGMVPIDEFNQGDEIWVPEGNESHRRSIYRMCERSGIIVTSSVGADRILRIKHLGLEVQRPQRPTVYRRAWDRITDPIFLAKVRERRANPDGLQKVVGSKPTLRGNINVYPWDKLDLGDFFIVPLRKGTQKEKHMMINGFRAASCRYDYEIQVIDWTLNVEGEETPALRVTMIQHNLAELKRRAAEKVGKRAVISDGRKTPAAMLPASKKRRRAFKAFAEAYKIDPAFLTQLVELLKQGDFDRACEAVIQRSARVEQVQPVRDVTRTPEPTPPPKAAEPAERPASPRTPKIRPDDAEVVPTLIRKRSSVDEGGVRSLDIPLDIDFGSEAVNAEVKARVAEVMHPDNFIGTADHPDYDRRAIMAQRIAAARKELGED